MLRQAFEKRLVFNYVDKNQDLYLPSLRSVLNDQIVQGSKPGRNFVSGVGCLLRVLRRLWRSRTDVARKFDAARRIFISGNDNIIRSENIFSMINLEKKSFSSKE